MARSTLLRIVSARRLVLGEVARARIEAEASLATLAKWTAASEGAASFLEE